MNIIKSLSLAVTLTSLVSASALAHSNFNMSCQTNLNAELSFANNELLVKSTSEQNILFTANGEVSVDGKRIELNSTEQKLAQQYYNDVEASIPMVVDITVEAINITNLALTEVFVGLLGEQSKVASTIDTKLSDLSHAIEQHVYQDPASLTFNSAYFENDLGLDSNFDQQMEEITEELVSTAMGEIFMVMGKAMLTGSSDFSDLETRMNQVGEEIEQKSELLAAQLEDKAEVLCDRFISLDKTETQLNETKALRDLDLIQLSKTEA